MIDLKKAPFVFDIHSKGGNIWYVGGCVRDEILGIESKDIDLLVTGFTIKDLAELLEKFGKADLVGVSFGVIKFTPHDSLAVTYDIAIPRTEVKNGEGHRGFAVIASSSITIEEDLFRRDFTINAIAKNILTEEFLDPYDGKQDITDRIIKAVNPSAFSDDPLRILRAIQFASRLGFSIDEYTSSMISINLKSLAQISKERVLEEFKKAFYKGDHYTFFDLIEYYAIMRHIITRQPSYECIKFIIQNEGNFKSFGEFMYRLGNVGNLEHIFLNDLKIDYKTMQEIRSIIILSKAIEAEQFSTMQLAIYESYRCSDVADRLVSFSIIEPNIKAYKAKGLPRSLKDLAVNGDTLREWGYTEGLTVGDILKRCIQQVLLGNIKNTTEDIKWYVENTEKTTSQKTASLLRQRGL